MTNETPTPRTDAVQLSGSVAHSWSLMRDHARQLERELIEAKEQIVRLDGCCSDYRRQIGSQEAYVLQTEQQRDQWRECAEGLADRLSKTVCSSDDESWQALSAYNKLKDQ